MFFIASPWTLQHLSAGWINAPLCYSSEDHREEDSTKLLKGSWQGWSPGASSGDKHNGPLLGCFPSSRVSFSPILTPVYGITYHTNYVQTSLCFRLCFSTGCEGMGGDTHPMIVREVALENKIIEWDSGTRSLTGQMAERKGPPS